MMNSPGLLTTFVGVCACLGSVSPAGAVVWYVDCDGPTNGDGRSWAAAYDSLSDALAAAQPGDQIWVAGGRYVGSLTLKSGVKVYGGFVGTETELTQRDWAANATILDGNTGRVVTSPPGATATTRIDGFTITNGSASYGGGLLLDNSSPTIANNTITGNSASYGGGLYLSSSSPTIANNTITGNSASYGGGLYLGYSSPTIANNTITGNNASSGGGLYLRNSSPTIANTIIAFNSSGIYIYRYGGSIDTPTLRNNCVYGNTKYDYSGLANPTGTNGNISADPRFADLRYGNAHIQPDSPCVDGGSNPEAFGNSDMDGEPRVQPLGGTVDIGADESDGTVCPAGPYVIVRVSPAGDDANDGSGWALAKRTVQAGIDAASGLGGEVWVQAGRYGEHISLHPYAYVYGGFAGVETVRDERDWGANVTTLDGKQQGSVVTVRAGYRFSAIDGFAITNGLAIYGGGLYLWSSSPTIANNTITGNNASSGGGLYLNSSSPTIANNTVTGNNAASGGGLFLESSSPTMANNTITGNSAEWGGGGLDLSSSSPTLANNTITGNRAYWGGGVSLNSSSPTIANNTIAGNNADEDGGGLWLYYSSPTITNNAITGNIASYDGGGLLLDNSSPTIANNTITGNSAVDYGGGLYLYSSSPTIANNTITRNGADYSGGGLYLGGSSSPTIANNTITGNSAFRGGGVSLNSSSPTIANNTITGNNASSGGGLYLRNSSPTLANTIIAFNSSGIRRLDTTSTPTLRHNCVYGNIPYDGLTDPTGTDGNISADPRFVRNPDPGADGNWGTGDDDDGDLHLLAESPCINTGDNARALGDVDLDGDPRLVGCFVDMGAYEYQEVLPLPADFDDDCDVDLIDYGGFEACATDPAGQPPGQCECFDLDGSGRVDLLDFAIFQVTFTGG